MKNYITLIAYSIFFSLSFFAAISVHAQSCNLQFTYTTSESRCMATGSITVTATGGSGNYNYKVTGPVSTPFTSSNVITGLMAGTYTIVVTDVNTACQTQQSGAVVGGSYSDPRFQLAKTDITCAGNDGTISTNSLQYGLSPFTYTIISPSVASIGTTNTTGNFTNLAAGAYYVQLKDSCGGIQVRSITINNYSWWINSVTASKTDCNTLDATVNVTDSKGNTNATGTSFAGFMYGVMVNAGDTTWSASNHMQMTIGTKRSVTFFVKDNCGKRQQYIWSVPEGSKPSVSAAVTISNKVCASFSATISGQQNLTAPQYSLYNSANVVVATNTTGIFNTLAYGSYCIKIKDACYDTTISRCFSATHSVSSVNAAVGISNRTCTAFTATISGQTNLTTPQYCLYTNSGVQISCNTTGIFNNVGYGSYSIKIKDGCTDTTIVRTFTAGRLAPVLNTPNISNNTCSSFTVSTNGGSNLSTPHYCLYNSAGIVVTCNTTGQFTGLAYGSYCIKAITDCGDTSNSVCIKTTRPVASVSSAVQISNTACTTFSAAITGQTNLTNPQYCLYNSANTLVTCNTTGVFNYLAYGSYCIKIKDGCIDTTISRCFSKQRAVPSINATMTQSNFSCTGFTATVSGSNLTSPQYYLYDANNKLVANNTTGIFTGVPYGKFCATIKDGCVDTSMKICQTFTLTKSITVTAAKTCNIGKTDLQIKFASPNGPYKFNIYDPADSMVYTNTSTAATATAAGLAALPTGLKYKVVGMDNCGNKDSVYVVPDATQINRNVVVTSKCPSAAWQNGSGDMAITCSSNLYAVTPTLIAKDGKAFSRSYSSSTTGYFAYFDLEPATYIIQYALQNCTGKVYDTVTVKAYTFPNQSQSAIYQCNNNSLSLSAAVNGGVGPFQYEIIGSLPDSPSAITPRQSSPIFTIDNGTIYTLLRLRSIDACGNATLSDVSVLPLQNIVVSASSTCLYKNVTLSVDSLPNTTYQWFKKRTETATDSTLVGTSSQYTIPFLQEEGLGVYVSKVSVNNDCLTRLAYYTLTGDCGYTYLPVALQLSGEVVAAGNQLKWSMENEKDIVEYMVERSSDNTSYKAIGQAVAYHSSARNTYLFMDNSPTAFSNSYRIKTLYKDGKIAYSNTITLSNSGASVSVYPNPVTDALQVTFKTTEKGNYTLDLFNTAGQIIFNTQLQNISNTTFTYSRNNRVPSGTYLLKVVNTTTNVVKTYKVVFK